MFLCASEFLEVTADGILNLATSRQLLIDIAKKSENHPVDHELFIDFRTTQSHLSMTALSEVVWSPRNGKDYPDFLRRLRTHLQRLDVLDVNYRLLS